MHLSKSYRLLRLLNKRHAVPTRAFFAAAGWLIVWASSLSPRLSGRVASVLWNDDFKSGLRLVHWFARRGWMGLEIATDPFFDFASWFTIEELDDLERFLRARARPENEFEDKTDRLYVLASRAHIALEQGQIIAFQGFQSEYEALAEETLPHAACNNRPAVRGQKPSKFSSTAATVALHDFDQLAHRIGLKWYVISGTFLGIVREGGWLAHDYDIDVGVHAEHLDLNGLRAAIAADPRMTLRKEDWQTRIVEDPGRPPRLEKLPALVKIVHRTGINIDVFIHHLEDGKRWHGSNIHRWDNADFPLRQYELAGLQVEGPADPDAYLTENYGDWRTPVTDFNSSTGTPNLVAVNNLLSKALFMKRGIIVKKGDVGAVSSSAEQR